MAKRGVKKKQFRPDFGVFVCPHVLDGASVLEVVRDGEGDWQFRCGDTEADSAADLILVAVGDVLAADPSLAVSVELDISTGIERRATYKDWDSFTVEE
ncbi:MAG: hypothetical protein GJ671_00375 [Alteromonadaceae bacterium]|nr:hypothetical protein [Alteromonadaceae bacterium]